MTEKNSLKELIDKNYKKHLRFVIYLLISSALIGLSAFLYYYFSDKYEIYTGFDSETYKSQYEIHKEFLIPKIVSLIFYIGTVVLASLCMIMLVVHLVKFLHNCWTSIQSDGYAITTPTKAVGFLFIPIFNFYWIFITYFGLSRQINSYIDRHQLDKRLYSKKGQTLAFCIFTVASVLIPFVGWFACSLISIILYFMVITDIRKSSLYVAENQK
ncbi:MAG: hypothetical protein NTW29_02565 [Bacteroidetes bacterium]|nr:hypothetical protein [Bacteroidota bacterium]